MWTWLRRYAHPLIALTIGLPLTLYAVVASFAWFAQPFPGFLLMENAVIPTVSSHEWPPDKARVFHSQVVAVDGQPMAGSAPIYGLVSGREPGTQFTYTLRKAGEEFPLTLPSRPFTLLDYAEVDGILLIIAFMGLSGAVIVGIMQPEAPQGRLFARMSLVTCLWTSSAIFLHLPDHPVLTRLYFLAEAFYPATVAHLSLHFPVNRRYDGAWRLLPVLPYLLSAFLVGAVFRDFLASAPAIWPLHAVYLYTATSLFCFAAALVYGYWENRIPAARLRVKAILPSFVVCGTLMASAFIDNALGGGQFPMQLGVIFVPLLFVSVGYAIAKHDLFDIDRVVRQSFVYALVSIVVIAAYAAVLALPARFLPALTGGGETLLGMLFVLVLAFLLDPLRQLMQRIVDRAFYRTRLDYRATIGELSAVMTTLLDLQQVVAQVTRVVTDAMHLQATTVCLWDDRGDRITVFSRRADADVQRRELDLEIDTLRGVLRESPEAISSAALLLRIPDGDGASRVAVFLAEMDASVVLPLVVRGRAIGMLALGAKRSGQPFASDDTELLHTLANQTAIAVQNARSYHDLEALTLSLDEKVRQQTDDLRHSNEQLSDAYDELKSAQAQLVQSEKMASLGQLVAGVAHELNNPVSFVHGGLANLEEYLRRIEAVLHAYEQVPIVDTEQGRAVQRARDQVRLDYVLQETPALLRICQEGSERIKKIVDDLRVFARADQGERVATDITAGIGSTLRLLSNRINGARIALDTAYETVPPIDAHAGQLNQVWMNLLVNAADAVAGRPDAAIHIAVRTPTSDRLGATTKSMQDNGNWIEVAISDNGIGIGTAERARIFEPFFTTKPVGQGTGLGLSIVYGAVKSHGGTIDVESEPGRGTCVTVRLPISQSERGG